MYLYAMSPKQQQQQQKKKKKKEEENTGFPNGENNNKIRVSGTCVFTVMPLRWLNLSSTSTHHLQSLCSTPCLATSPANSGYLLCPHAKCPCTPYLHVRTSCRSREGVNQRKVLFSRFANVVYPLCSLEFSILFLCPSPPPPPFNLSMHPS